MKCHSCKTGMELKRTASGDRSTTKWYKCPVCHSEHMRTRLIFNEDSSSADLDPYNNFIVSNSQPINANDENNFQLRQLDYH